MTAIATAVPAGAASTNVWRFARQWGSVQGYFSAYSSVAATGPHDAWAIGDLRNGQPFVVHYNGTGWGIARLALMAGYDVSDVVASSSHNVWVIGENSAKTVAFRFDGMHWNSITLPLNSLPDDEVTFGPADAWVRYGQDTYHWNGATWQDFPVKAAGVQITGIAGTSDNFLWAAGSKPVPNSGGAGIIVAYRFANPNWSPVSMPANLGKRNPGIGIDAMNDVWIGSPTRDLKSVFALHYNGSKWTRVTTPSSIANTADGLPVPDGHGGVWLGPWVHWTGHAWLGLLHGALPGFTGSIEPLHLARVPGTAGSLWETALYWPPNSSTPHPAILIFGPTP